ncbi:uncharacterized protein LOC106163659 [Lingula anatina]|uniref:Uncharacterized protein LOC106163659 n=1 Tax=Lingula anatina TaxID=7574 RepID=A0A1S3IET5_LINAN|nr:uncharacterized protein LOC106163659 [Lingula anatina]|eukprot:XP_013396775.1 uncharacterized protein LOC106163659 [Lingula anatina]
MMEKLTINPIVLLGVVFACAALVNCVTNKADKYKPRYFGADDPETNKVRKEAARMWMAENQNRGCPAIIKKITKECKGRVPTISKPSLDRQECEKNLEHMFDNRRCLKDTSKIYFLRECQDEIEKLLQDAHQMHVEEQRRCHEMAEL